MLLLLLSSHDGTSLANQDLLARASQNTAPWEKENMVRANCYQVRQAVELFAVLNAGIYPASLANVTPYGDTVIDLLPDGTRLVNPFTGLATEPVDGAAATLGQTGYVPVQQGGIPVGYTITGVGSSVGVTTVVLNKESPSELWSRRFGSVSCGERGRQRDR
jgi:hypothetical protein